MKLKEICFKKNLFGKKISLIVYDAEKLIVREIIEDAYKEGLRLQKIFNFFDDSSELSLLNKRRKLHVSKELAEVVKKALEFCKLTNGEYDISIGKMIMQRKNNKKITPINCSYKDIEIKRDFITIKNPDALIDLGSIAKGYITDKIVEFLKSKGIENGFVDARGDIRFFGNYEHVIQIEHPRKKSKKVCSIKLKNEAVATSGDYRQFNKTFRKSHILNQKDTISATVVAPTLEEADAYATALFVSNNDEIEDILKKNKKIKALIINKSLNLRMYNNFEKLVYKNEK